MSEPKWLVEIESDLTDPWALVDGSSTPNCTQTRQLLAHILELRERLADFSCHDERDLDGNPVYDSGCGGCGVRRLLNRQEPPEIKEG